MAIFVLLVFSSDFFFFFFFCWSSAKDATNPAKEPKRSRGAVQGVGCQRDGVMGEEGVSGGERP